MVCAKCLSLFLKQGAWTNGRICGTGEGALKYARLPKLVSTSRRLTTVGRDEFQYTLKTDSVMIPALSSLRTPHLGWSQWRQSWHHYNSLFSLNTFHQICARSCIRFVLVLWYIPMESRYLFTHILEGCFTGNRSNREIVPVPVK